MKRGELCNMAGCGGRIGTIGPCNHSWNGKQCPNCEYELIENTVSDAIFCGHCGYHKPGGGVLGKMIENIIREKGKQ